MRNFETIAKRAEAWREMAEAAEIARNNAARIKRGQAWGITTNEL